MDNRIDSDIQGFDEVWERVTAAGCPGPPPKAADDRDRLREFMDDEASDCLYYRELAKRCGGRQGVRLFLRLSAEEAGHLKALQKAWFILTGDTYAPVCTRPYITSLLAAVRERHLGELGGEKAYLKAASETADPRLEALYKELAADEACHARRTDELIGCMLS